MDNNISAADKSAMQLKPGYKLNNGKYTIQSVLGQGGYGITYLATDSSGRRFAIKEFFPASLCNRVTGMSTVLPATPNNVAMVTKLRQKFLKEAGHLRDFNHPNIVHVAGVFEQNETAYYVMDYIDGLSLDRIINNVGPLPVDKAVKYIEKIGQALSYIHARNMTHLDVKPPNIMVRREDDSPILIDFGLAKQYDDGGGEVSTTPTGYSNGFAPLEQYSGEGINTFSPRTDIYSLAATLYYLLTGKRPPIATLLFETSLNFPPYFPEALIAPIKKGMSPLRKNRHASVSEFLAEIDSTRIGNSNDETVIPIVAVNQDETVINTPPIPSLPHQQNYVKPQQHGSTYNHPTASKPSKKKSNKVLKRILYSILALVATAVIGYGIGLVINMNEEDTSGDLISTDETVTVHGDSEDEQELRPDFYSN